MKVLITGAAGFIGAYVVEEFLRQGYEIVELDNFSNYGPLKKSFQDHPSCNFVEADAQNIDLMKELPTDRDHSVAAAAMNAEFLIPGVCLRFAGRR